MSAGLKLGFGDSGALMELRSGQRTTEFDQTVDTKLQGNQIR